MSRKKEARKNKGRQEPAPAWVGRYRREILICLGLAAITWLVFAQVSHFQFVNWDDDRNLYQNPKVQAGLTLDSIVWAFTDTGQDYWHPVTWLSHLADWQLFGGDAGWHHIVSVLIHTLNVLLLFLLLRRITGAVWRSAAVAALFAIHPLRVESVAWVTERKDVLSALFWFLTTWAYVDYTRKSDSWKKYCLVAFLFALALMAKPSVMTLPFFLLLLDYWPLGRLKSPSSLPGLLREKIPLFALSAFSVALTYKSQHEGGMTHMVGYVPFPARLANSTVSYVAYLADMFWPARLAALYPFNRNIPAWQVAGAALLLGAITALVLWKAARFRYLAVGWFWYLGVLLPMIGLIQMGLQSRADRFTYLPIAGMFLLVVWSLHDLMAGWRHRTGVAIAMAAIILPALGVRAWSQVGTWKDGITLFQHNVSITPGNEFALLNLGQALDLAGREDEAIVALRGVLRVNPQSARAYDDLGNIHLRTGHMQESLDDYTEEIKIEPKGEAYYHRGAIYKLMKNWEASAPEYEEALRRGGLLPAFTVHAMVDLGYVLAQQEKNAEAAARFSEALSLDPTFLEARREYGLVLMKLGRTSEARSQFEMLVAANPGDTQARRYLNELTRRGF